MTYSTPISLSSQVFHCSLPLRLDAYQGCTFSCAYCFARNRGGETRTKYVSAADQSALSKILDRAASNAEHVSTVVEFVRAKVPVHFGGMSDPFQPAEEKANVAFEYLSTLREHQYPTVISTRSPLVASSKLIDVLRSAPVVVQFSMSTIDDKQSLRVEPYAPRPSKILKTMRTLADCGIRVTCRWQPYIVNFSPPIDEFVDAVATTGALQISLEHLKIPTEHVHSPLLARGSDVIAKAREYYEKAGAYRDGREFILPAVHKLQTVLKARQACHSRGIAFGASDNEFQFFSDGDACCSGVDVIAGFSTAYKFTIPHIIKRQLPQQSEIHFDASGLWRPTGPIDRFLNSKSRIGAVSAAERGVEHFLRRKWNDLKTSSSPRHYFGIKFTGEVDDQGMNIYYASSESISFASRSERSPD